MYMYMCIMCISTFTYMYMYRHVYILNTIYSTLFFHYTFRCECNGNGVHLWTLVVHMYLTVDMCP